MEKADHIHYWLSIAEKDLDMMHYLKEGRKYVQAIFFGHLYLEKFAKALWVKANVDNIPPKTHNLLKLIKEAGLELPVEDQTFLVKLNQYQIESRYPEDIAKLYQITDARLTSEYFDNIFRIIECIKGKMQ